jgi:DNA-binding MarR family transcriptional regulator
LRAPRGAVKVRTVARRKPGVDLELRREQADIVLALTQIRRRVERRATELLAAEGLGDVTSAQANALMVLFQARAPITARRLADTLAVSEVTVARFVRALEENGWVARTPDPDDRRAMLLVPTSKAKAALPRFAAVSNQILDAAFAGFDRAGIEALGRVVARVRDNLE